MSTPIDSLEWKTIQFVTDQLWAKASAAQGVELLAEAERAFLCVCIADAEICGGGFPRLFHRCPEIIRHLPAAYASVGLHELAGIVARASEVVPYPKETADERLRQWEELTAEQKARLDQDFERYCETKDKQEAVTGALYSFIQAHQAVLIPAHLP